MSSHTSSGLSRRTFVRQTGLLAGGMLLGTRGAARAAADETPGPVSGPLPLRTLGRTGAKVTAMTLGTAPCGLSPKIPPSEIAKIINYAVDQGITSIDTAPGYKQSEEGIGMALGSRRKEVFLASKVMADTLDEAEASLSKSLELLKTDSLDLVYYHSVASHDVPKAMEPDGVFSWLVKQKQAGKFRFLGISGHHKPGMFAQLLETGEVDVLLTVVNFVDRNTYNFEEKVLPIARERNVGIVAMKVFGGARKSAGSYANPQAPPELDVEHLELAVRYAMSVPGVNTLNLGVHNMEQVKKNIEMVRNCTPLTAEDRDKIASLGKELAAQWGEHLGPVV
ncbi:MAG: aldo/keto reductase [Planctomycetaceae bacterium]|nr:aldo/keto reductase [Planctomycetaceae bacterium]